MKMKMKKIKNVGKYYLLEGEGQKKKLYKICTITNTMNKLNTVEEESDWFDSNYADVLKDMDCISFRKTSEALLRGSSLQPIIICTFKNKFLYIYKITPDKLPFNDTDISLEEKTMMFFMNIHQNTIKNNKIKNDDYLININIIK